MLVSIFSIIFWKNFWITMRPYLLFVSGAAGLVGLAFTKEQTTFRIIVGFIPLFFSYGLGQALTDCFQTDTDALSSPYRPLVKGIISRRQVIVTSLVGLTLSVVILMFLNPLILLLGFLAVVGLLTYTPFKRTWWGGPPWNSWIVALLPIMGRLVDRDFSIYSIAYSKDIESTAFFLTILAVFFGYANFVVMGYLKDITADRQTGYRTFPVVFGWQPAAIYSDITALFTAVLTGMVLFLLHVPNLLAIIIYIVALITNLYAQITIHKIRDEKRAHGPIGNVVRAFVLYCMAMIGALQPNWYILIVIFYLFFELTLFFRPERSQV